MHPTIGPLASPRSRLLRGASLISNMFDIFCDTLIAVCRDEIIFFMTRQQSTWIMPRFTES